MRGLLHRELGMVGAMYGLPHTTAEVDLISHHVDPLACDIILMKQGKKCCLDCGLYDSRGA